MKIQKWVLVGLAALSGMSARSSEGFGGKFIRDDFSKPSGDWRYGYEHRSKGEGHIDITRAAPEVTLSGTAMNPANLSKGFAIETEFVFIEPKDQSFFVAWGKPYEWSRRSECPAVFELKSNGEYTVQWNNETIASGAFPKSEEFRYAIALNVTENSVQVGDEPPVTLPQGNPNGYLLLGSTAHLKSKWDPVLKINRVAVQTSGKKNPITEAEWKENSNEWLRQEIAKNDGWLDRLEKEVDVQRAKGTYGFSRNLKVEPALVKVGEVVRVRFESDTPPGKDDSFELLEDFMKPQKRRTIPLKLKWKSRPSGGYYAEYSFAPNRAGNWSVVWNNADGKIRRLVGALDDESLAIRFHITAKPALAYKALNKPKPPLQDCDVIHNAGLAADFWSVGPAKWNGGAFTSRPAESLATVKVFVDYAHRYGDGMTPLVNGDYFVPNNPDHNVYRMPLDVQKRGFEQLIRMWSIYGLPPLKNIASYSRGHETTAVAESLGIESFDSLCEWQHWRDGQTANDWNINHTGASPFPYFSADDDYRKVGKKRVLGLSQGNASSVRQYTVFANESHPNLSCMRHGRGTDYLLQVKNVDRFNAMVDTLPILAANQKMPLFFMVGLESFTEFEDWNGSNILGVRYLIEKAKTHNIVFTQAAGIVDYYFRHYKQQPENWLFWPDYYAGFHRDAKPQEIPDRIELLNDRYHTEHRYGKTLPRYWFDYTVKWDNRVWEPFDELRSRNGIVDPKLLDESNISPRVVSAKGIEVSVKKEAVRGGVKLIVDVESPRKIETLPLAVWDLPLDARDLSFTKEAKHCRFVKVVDGSSGNLHGVIECRQVPAGKSRYVLELKGRQRIPVNTTLAMGNNIRGRMFLRENNFPTVYLWLDKPEQGELKIDLKGLTNAADVFVEYVDGSQVKPQNGTLAIKLKRSWVPHTSNPGWQYKVGQVVGLTADQIAERGTFK